MFLIIAEFGDGIMVGDFVWVLGTGNPTEYYQIKREYKWGWNIVVAIMSVARDDFSQKQEYYQTFNSYEVRPKVIYKNPKGEPYIKVKGKRQYLSTKQTMELNAWFREELNDGKER